MPEQQCLRFDSQAAWQAARIAAGWPATGAPPSAAVVEVGRLHKPLVPTGQRDADGGQLMGPPVWLPGWHVNVVMLGGAELPPVLAASEVLPEATRHQVWGCEPQPPAVFVESGQVFMGDDGEALMVDGG